MDADRMTRRRYRAEVRRLSAQLDAARAVEAAFAVFANVPTPLEDAVGEAWDAARDAVREVECALNLVESQWLTRDVPAATLALVRANID